MDASGDDVAHRRGVARGVALHERLGRRACRDRVVQHVEVVLGNRQHRVVGDRRGRVAFGDGLKVLQRLGIAARPIELQAAFELSSRLFLDVGLRRAATVAPGTQDARALPVSFKKVRVIESFPCASGPPRSSRARSCPAPSGHFSTTS